jgi:hypothetical protein
MHVLLNASVDLIRLSYCLREHHRLQYIVYFLYVQKLINKTELQEICLTVSHPSSSSYRKRTISFFCRTACTNVTDNTFRLFYKLGNHTFTHIEFKLHTVYMSVVSGSSGKMRPQWFLIISALEHVFCILSSCLWNTARNFTAILTGELT